MLAKISNRIAICQEIRHLKDNLKGNLTKINNDY